MYRTCSDVVREDRAVEVLISLEAGMYLLLAKVILPSCKTYASMLTVNYGLSNIKFCVG